MNSSLSMALSLYWPTDLALKKKKNFQKGHHHYSITACSSQPMTPWLNNCWSSLSIQLIPSVFCTLDQLSFLVLPRAVALPSIVVLSTDHTELSLALLIPLLRQTVNLPSSGSCLICLYLFSNAWLGTRQSSVNPVWMNSHVDSSFSGFRS